MATVSKIYYGTLVLIRKPLLFIELHELCRIAYYRLQPGAEETLLVRQTFICLCTCVDLDITLVGLS